MAEDGTQVRADDLNLAGKPSPANSTNESVVSDMSIDIPARKETCSICFDDDINIDQMFYVDKCHHGFCSECMRRYIEVRLLEGSLMTCPHDGCISKLFYQSCFNLLTPKLKELWARRRKEDSIPVTKRVYCPNPRCSALMSETELYVLEETGVCRYCGKCNEPFCIFCKVPWHHNLSCDSYKSLHPDHTENDSKLKALANKKKWRQCEKCQHMIELSRGCVNVVCRCGNNFCFLCGAEAGGCTHGHGFYNLTTRRPLFTEWCICLCYFVIFLVLAAFIGGIIAVIIHFVK